MTEIPVEAAETNKCTEKKWVTIGFMPKRRAKNLRSLGVGHKSKNRFVFQKLKKF